tara:strand:+ start:1840 stop:2091 length:252 start_codon:yes stop_codon:yes gene_type:complete
MKFKKGDYYSLFSMVEHEGFINFQCSDYVTLVLREWEKPEALQHGARNKFQQVQLVVFPWQYKDLKFLGRNHYEKEEQSADIK